MCRAKATILCTFLAAAISYVGYTTVALTVVVVGISVVIYFYRKDAGLNLPPGPWCLPVLGYYQYVRSDSPHELLDNLMKKYGKIFGLQIGCRYCVVLNDYKSVKEAFNKKELLARPPNYMKLSPDTKNFIEMRVPDWSDHYQFIINGFKHLGVGRNRFEVIVLDELSRAIPRLESQVGAPRLNIHDALKHSVTNTIFQVICSQWFDDDHPLMKTFSKFQTLLLESLSNNMAPIYYPWLIPVAELLSPEVKEIWKTAGEIESLIRTEISEREKIHNEGMDNDYLDLFLTEMKARQRKDPSSTFNRDVLTVNSAVLLLSGSDTVRNALEWCFLFMAKHQDIQEKVHKELDTVLGTERAPCLNDKGTLPFTEAVILEVGRFRTEIPINLLRWSTEKTTIQGYDIPKGTIIIHNMWACDHDSAYWDKPDQFKPERFLSKDQSRVVVPEHYIPFSIGRRTCVGEKMAQIVMFLYFTTIMQKFKFLPPAEGVDFRPKHRVNTTPVNPILRVAYR